MEDSYKNRAFINCYRVDNYNILVIEQKRKRENEMSEYSGNEAVIMKNVCKDFKVLNRHEGLKGSIKDLFSRDYKTVSAVKDVTLTVNRGEMLCLLLPSCVYLPSFCKQSLCC